ncbi:hypothetical protein [Rhizobium sp. RU36D]|uniref:hypothetical protein n=1 Tax=Rhizobium sp. RU36D TaxID=1907415 RepID=UPI0009D83A27|nr:hypothetical protein [Rhizobium sp. RU36D]SMD18583.1 hypothetical protein SAMN05880593_13539 [Rhizobium sp. RU36D]
MTDNHPLNAMIANFAVLEQLVINLTQIISSDFEDPMGVRLALLQDLRSRFDLSKPDDGAGRELYRLANIHLDRLEPRILGDTSEAEKQ